ncbi:Protein kinase domain-containing protein [Aphelenchoides besseyi]|nr:Protein kinase domain-containing protein [Aphelenchoides besseyi]
MTLTLTDIVKRVRVVAARQLFTVRSLLTGRGLQKFNKQYVVSADVLGNGGFGVVYAGHSISNYSPVAVKFVERKHVLEWGKLDDENLPMEICMLSACSQIDGVINLINYFTVPEGFLIVMERPLVSIDLYNFINEADGGALSEDLTQFIFRQVVNTVYECMQRKIVHRDIKNENIVIDLISGNTKLIDFGAATFTSSRRRRNFQGTRLYTAPEYFHSALYLDMEATVWSLGVVLYSALNGQLPFLTQKDVMTKHLLGPLPKFTVYSTEAEELIRSCLAYEPSDRISLKALRSHRWLSRLENSDWESLTKDLKIMKNDLKSLSSSSFESGVGSSNEQSNAIVLDETSLRNEKTNENVDHQYNETSSTRRTKHRDVKLSAIDCPETYERKPRRILPKMSRDSGISSPLASPLILKH